MRKSAPFLSLIGLLCGRIASLPAQASPPDSATVQAAAAVLRSDLRNLVTAQEAYFADHATYARWIPQIDGYRPSRGVTVVLVTASDSSHSEVAIIDKAPGLVCAVFVGEAPRPFGTGKEGVPVCRAPSGPVPDRM